MSGCVERVPFLCAVWSQVQYLVCTFAVRPLRKSRCKHLWQQCWAALYMACRMFLSSA